MSCLNCFLGNGSLYRFQYGVSGVTLIAKIRSGICTTAKSDPPEAMIHRAMYLLQNGFGKYDVFSHNCKDFALYCKTGLVVCSRKAFGLSGQASSVADAPVGAILSLPLKMFVSNLIVLCATTLGNYSFSRYFSDPGVRRDVKKVEVEDFATFHADLPAEKDPCTDGAEKDSSRIEFCKDGPCQLRLQPGDCQWFEEPCIGRVKEILSELSSRNRSLEEKLESAEKENALLAKSFDAYKIACDAERMKLKQ